MCYKHLKENNKAKNFRGKGKKVKAGRKSKAI